MAFTPLSSGEEELIISYLDVGQGDSAFLLLPNGESVLIDAGNQTDGGEIIQALRARGVETLDYVVATHPHADHIGGMAEVLAAFEVRNIYLPKKAHTSATFERLLDVIEEKGLTINTAKAGVTLFDYGSLKAEFLAPNSDSYKSLNNYSAVLLLTYGDRRFLFMGDAERESEAELLAGGYSLCADLLKVGHHGSSTSSTRAFLEAVRPSYAVISVGAHNSYGHPAATVLAALSGVGADIWRTDERGTIVATCDGVNLTLFANASVIRPNAPPAAVPSEGEPMTVYITKSGTKYHREGCRHLSKSKIAVPLDELDCERYAPCSVCNPPEKERDSQ